MIRFRCPLFPTRVAFSVDRKDHPAAWEGAQEYNGVTGTLPDGTLYIAVYDGKLSTLAHELVHATGFILAHAGVRASFDNDETQAYLTQWLFEKLEKHV